MSASRTVEELLKGLPAVNTNDEQLIRKAYSFAEEAHKDQARYSGEPYFIHLYETALILKSLDMDPVTIAAGLLHDSIEDTQITSEEFKEKFGEEIFLLVDGVTKLGKVKYRGVERHVESLRKFFIATSKDIRVLIIKLSDRLHNMRTLEFVPEHKRARIALETLEVYAPIAHRLGIGHLKGELEDLAFKHAYPAEYKLTVEISESYFERAQNELTKLHKKLLRKLSDEGIFTLKTDYRRKHLWSLYKKLVKTKMDISKIYDIMALRLIVSSMSDCYRALGIVHAIWRPLPGRIKDYIAFPKPNGYQSLHTTIFTGEGSLAEIQIRTPEMHQAAEFGIASHVQYKHGQQDSSALSWVRKLIPSSWRILKPHSPSQPSDASLPSWISEMVEAQDDLIQPQVFLRRMKSDFLEDRIFVFTPKGDVIDLPIDSSTIDFAYHVHSDVGDHMQGAKVNGKLASFSTKLKNGDIVEIMTSPKAHPTQKWLDNSRTILARRSIKQHLNKDKEPEKDTHHKSTLMKKKLNRKS